MSFSPVVPAIIPAAAPPFDITSLRLSHSTLGGFHACPRLTEFSKFYGLRIRTSGIPADIGSCLHAAYQEYFRTKNKLSAFTALLKTYPAAAIESTPANRYSIESLYATLLEMFNHNIAGQYEIAQIQTPTGLQPAIEVPIQINITNFSLSDAPIPSIPVFYVGFIDFILYDILNDTYIVVDIKTHSNNLADLSPKYRFDMQCMPYAMVLERIIGHKLTNFRVAYFSVYIDLEEPKAKMFEFQKTDLDVQEWARGFAIDLKLLKSYYQTGWFRRDPSHCMAFRRPCTYYDFCPSRNKETILAQLELHKDSKPEIPINPWFTLDLELEGLTA